MIRALILNEPPGIEMQYLELRRLSDRLCCEDVIDLLRVLVEAIAVALFR